MSQTSKTGVFFGKQEEIAGLNKEKDKYTEIISMKLMQLRRLNWSLVLMYIGILLFLSSGVLGAIIQPENIYTLSSMIAGVGIIILAIVLLIIYGFKSIYIRERHLKL